MLSFSRAARIPSMRTAASQQLCVRHQTIHPPANHPIQLRQLHTSKPTPQFSNRYQASQNLRVGVSRLARRWYARPTFRYEVGGLGAVGGGFYVYNLEEVPVSGRRRFNVVSASFERQLGEQQYHQILEQYKGAILSDYDPRTVQVRRVLDRLIPHSGLPADYDWQIHVIESQETNAFVIPGGKVFVFTGILPVCNDDDGLAAVLGHEIGHNVARHIAEQMSRGVILVAVAWIVELFYGIPGQISQQLLQLAIDRPKSRAQESEADYIGLMMMAQSCYNPAAAVTLWQRMQVLEEKMAVPPEMLSTHPSSAHRQVQLQALLPKAEAMALDSNCNQVGHYVDAFKRRVKDDFSFDFR